MSSAGRCIARSTSSGMVVGPGIARNSRPARTTIFLVPCWFAGGKGCRGMAGNSSQNMMIISSLRAQAKQSISPNDGICIASSRSVSTGAHSRDPLAPRNDGNQAGSTRLFPQRISDPSPDLILDFGRGRARDDGGGAGALVAGLDQPQDPDLAIGVIEIAAAVAPGHGETDAGHLIFGIDNA